MTRRQRETGTQYTSEESPTEPTPGVQALRKIMRSSQLRFGLILLGGMLLVAVLGPLVAPYSPTEIIGKPFADPGNGALLGTDGLGRDVLSRVLYGGYNLLWMSTLAALGGVAVGTAIGLIGAYAGGATDMLLMRAMDVMLTLPTILLAILFVSMVGPTTWMLVILLILGHTPGMSRVIRGAALPVIQQEHVLWANAVGLSRRHILFREVLPMVTSPLVVEFGLRLMWSVSILASLSFLGFGLQPPAASWGLMISENRSGMAEQPLAVLIPVACIAVFTIGANLFAEGAARVIAHTEGKGTVI